MRYKVSLLIWEVFVFSSEVILSSNYQVSQVLLGRGTVQRSRLHDLQLPILG